MSDIKLIAGLGNPGREYENTRHNIGFEVIDNLARKLGVEVRQKKFGSLFGQAEFEGKKLILLKPQSYMNRSGQAVATVKGFYKLEDADIMVAVDDTALEPGVIRVRAKGSAGGHNGLRDIIEKLGTDEYARLRVGVGQSPFADKKSHVLGKITKQERDAMDEAVERAVQAVLSWCNERIGIVMSRFNATNNVDENKNERE